MSDNFEAKFAAMVKAIEDAFVAALVARVPADEFPRRFSEAMDGLEDRAADRAFAIMNADA